MDLELLNAAITEKVEETTNEVDVKPRKTIKGFLDTIKSNLIDLFQEEEDKELK